MDKLIWLDGHTTTISSEEAFRKSREELDENGEYIHVLYHYDSRFVLIDSLDKPNTWKEVHETLIDKLHHRVVGTQNLEGYTDDELL